MARVKVLIQRQGFEEIKAYFGSTVSNMRDLNPPLKKSGNLMLRSVDQNFKWSGRPTRWRPLKRSTILRKLKDGYGVFPLIRTGKLRRSIVFNIKRPAKLAIGTSIPYSPYHQFGTRKIPARPYLIFQKLDLERIENLIINHITGAN